MRNYTCDPETIGNNLKRARLNAAKPMTQLDFALEVGLTDSVIGRIERGLRYPTIEILFDYMNKFNVDANVLLGCEPFPEVEACNSVDARLQELDDKTRMHLYKVFMEMIDFHLKNDL